MSRPALLTAAALALLITAPTIHADQPEHGVQVIEGQEPTPLGYHQYTTGATINTAVDIDLFTFCGIAGETVFFRLDSTANFMDPVLELFDPQGTKVTTQSCQNECSFIHAETLMFTGTYTIVMSDNGSNQGGSYRLQLEPLIPKLNMPSLQYGVPVSDLISPNTDMDYFLIAMEAGRLVRFTIDTTANFMDPVFKLRDPDGGLVVSDSCQNQCSFTVNYTAAVTGVHVVSMCDNGINQPGTYTLSATCLLGGCPTGAASQWLNLGNGLAGSVGCPTLFAEGPLTLGSATTLTLDKALPDSTAWLVVGFQELDLPFKGGVLVPSPDVSVGLPTGMGGFIQRNVLWPVAPPGFEFFCQYWIPDPAGPFGFAASNAVRGVTP